MSPLFGKKSPRTITCPFCSEQVEDSSDAKMAHWETHLIPVTDNNGQLAFAFECPRCGPSDLAWGGGRPEEVARSTAAAGVAVHVMERHGITP